MTPDQWQTLAAFRGMTKDYSGRTIDVRDYSYATMCWLNQLQRRLGAPILLIRGNHGPDGSAVDWCCPDVPYARLAMEVLSLPLAVGLYSGMSVHTDSRPLVPYTRPARWMAVHEDEEDKLGDLRRLIYRRDDGWSYLVWSERDGLAFQALQTVVALAEARRMKTLGAERET
jgi:hypothetical protein